MLLAMIAARFLLVPLVGAITLKKEYLEQAISNGPGFYVSERL